MARKSIKWLGRDLVRGGDGGPPVGGEEEVKQKEPGRPFPWARLLPWLLCGAAAVLAILFFFSSDEAERAAEVERGRTALMCDLVEALVSGDHVRIREAVARARGAPGRAGEVAGRVDVATRSRDDWLTRRFKEAAVALGDEEVERLLGGAVEAAARRRLARMDPRRLAEALGEEKIGKLLEWGLGRAETKRLVEMLGRRGEILAAEVLSETPAERMPQVLGAVYVRVVRDAVARVAGNAAALDELLGGEVLERLALTYVYNQRLRDLAPLLEDLCDGLAREVAKWRDARRVTVLTKSGESLDGVLLREDKSEVVLRLSDGSKKTLLRSEVKEIQRRKPPEKDENDE